MASIIEAVMTSQGTDSPRAMHLERRSIRRVIVRDLLNTTWRMLVPTLIGLFLGMGLDHLLASTPFGFLIGALIGFIVGLVLALRLLHKAEEMHV